MDEEKSAEPRSVSYVLLYAVAFLVGWSLARLHTPTDGDREPVQPQDHAAPESRLRQPDAPIAPQIPPALTEQHQPERRGDNTPPWKKRAEVIAIGIAAGLLLVNIFALCAAKGAADTARKQLEMSERPYIQAIISPIHFTADTNTTNFQGTVVLKNIGNSVAIGVSFNPWIVLVQGKETFTKPVEYQRKVCGDIRKLKTPAEQTSGALNLFPAEQTKPLGFSVTVSDIESETFTSESFKVISPTLVGCVDYRFTFAPTEHHQTPFIYDVYRYVPDHPTFQRLPLRIGETLTPPSLIIDHYIFGGDYPD